MEFVRNHLAELVTGNPRCDLEYFRVEVGIALKEHLDKLRALQYQRSTAGFPTLLRLELGKVHQSLPGETLLELVPQVSFISEVRSNSESHRE